MPNKSLGYFCFLTQPISGLGSNVTLACTVSTEGSNIVFRGEGVWNDGPNPPSWRFYLTSNTNTYNNIYEAQHPDEFWFSQEWQEVTAGTFTLSAAVPELPFAPVRAGIALAGGWYYDVGIAVSEGTAIVRILDFQIQ